MQCPERGTLRNSYTSSGGGLIRDLLPHGRMDMFWGCLSAGTASGSIVHQQLTPTESTTRTFPTFIPPRGASRWRAAPRWRESLAPANRAARLHCPTRDPAATAGSRTSPRRLGHSTAPSASRRCSPRVSALPDILCAGWPCVGGGGAQGCASARGLRRGLVGSQEDCALLASWRGRCGGQPPM